MFYALGHYETYHLNEKEPSMSLQILQLLPQGDQDDAPLHKTHFPAYYTSL